ncbi:uncharacterized protein SPSK_08752 [Sporothrix schenckii 1099-18]|uniref:Uncharacterized protein n=1 Tax=Sporothrix schenckii 1099-18 TaxID=1397361 RepID=A0A0F2M651_SPOSC|nr:uncharacterized protein SPSK_08752 [Sporothrix schenckii 1099-18]KJR85107.1 hypothetical protein SPSK_08752 [Sporothrix schenckii 1099-18]
MTDRPGSPPPTDLGTTTTTSTSGDDAASSDLLAQLYRDRAALQQQLDDERRLRREAEDIIDQRQDEVYERDALVRALREELRKSSGGSSDHSGGSDHGHGHGHAGPDNGQRKAEPGRAPPPIPIPILAGPSPAVDPGLTKAQAKAAYAALIASIQSFVAARLAPVFAVPTRDLEAAIAAVHAATDADTLTPANRAAAAAADAPASPPPAPSTYYTVARPRVLLRFMTPRARMFLRLKGADSVHFYAILIEFLRRRVFDEPYGGIFKLSGGPVPPLLLGDYDLGLSPTTPTSPPEPNSVPEPKTARGEGKRSLSGPRPLSKIEARLERVDGLARQLGALLHDIEAEPKSASVPVIGGPVPVPVSAALWPSRHPEARRFRVQLIDRILGVVPATLPSSTTAASARVAALARYIDTRVVHLSADLSRALLPLEMARQVAEAVAATTATPTSSSTTPPTTDAAARHAVDRRAATYASLERQVAADVVRPAVELAVALQLAVPEYSVRWLEHANDSPSLSVCEALGLDAQRIRFRGDKDDADDGDGDGDGDSSSNKNADEPYSFVFDITPALSMRNVDASNNGKDYVPNAVIYAQGVLVQQGQVVTERTFVHWLHETGIKPKDTFSVPKAWPKAGKELEERRKLRDERRRAEAEAMELATALEMSIQDAARRTIA